MRTTRALLIFAGLAPLSAACDAEATNDFLGGKAPIPPEPMTDSGMTPMPEAGPSCMPMSPADCSGGAVVDACSSPAADNTGTIKGTVTASAMPEGGYEAKGDLVISVLPMFDATACAGDGPAPAALTIIHCADLTAGKAVPFEIKGVPARAQAWKIVPFLDTNSNSLDGCDLISFPSDASVTKAGQTTSGVSLKLGLGGGLLVAPPNKCGYMACM